MLTHTKAYVIWRSHSQQILDFAVMVCTAAPQLMHALSAHAADPTSFVAINVGFPPSIVPYSTERRALATYSGVLGATVLLSVFSYFETYFFSAVDELLEFHGGEAGLEKVISAQLLKPTLTPKSKIALDRLRTRHKGHAIDRYRKASAALRSEKIVWPSHRLMLYGLKQALAQKKRWKSADIPDLMRELLTMKISSGEQDRFHAFRTDRNTIAHGRSLNYDLQKAVGASNFFREVAAKVDAHIVENFMVIEQYAH